ncbi:MmpS family transport accessory protein [Pseudonocardia sediminis]|uniref:MmpS family transport accessory protein n=1 Tax=Pseudonocardia sediminis TaxID=1397368 RepID=UPI001029261B|nr:MmpS family transport accessory protein [Pseudonocardia sediminis]
MIDRPDAGPEYDDPDDGEAEAAYGAPSRPDHGGRRREPERAAPVRGDDGRGDDDRGATGRRRRPADPTPTPTPTPTRRPVATSGPGAPERWDRGPSERPGAARDRWHDPAGGTPSRRPSSDLADRYGSGRHAGDDPGADDLGADRHGTDRHGARRAADPVGFDGRPPRRRAPQPFEPDEIPADDGYRRARRAADVAPSAHDRPRRGRHGSGGYVDRIDAGGHAADRHGADRHAAPDHGIRHGTGDVDDRYEADAGGRVPAARHGAPRYDDTRYDEAPYDDTPYDDVRYEDARYDDRAGHGPDRTVGPEPGRHGPRYRANGHARPTADAAGRLDRGRPGYAPGEFAPDAYDDRDPGDGFPQGFAPDERDAYEPGTHGPGTFERDADVRTALLPVGGGGPGRRRAPDVDDLDAPVEEEPMAGAAVLAAEEPGEEAPRRLAPSGEDDEPARRRRWPWVVGGVAAAAVAVTVGLIVLGGTEEQRAPALADNVVGLDASSGNGQPGAAPAASSAAPQPAAAQVTYEVTGSGSADTITFGRGSSVAQVSDAELPWTRTAPAVEGTAEYTVTAAGGSGEISCKILVDGAVLAEEKADGDFAAVSCSARR